MPENGEERTECRETIRTGRVQGIVGLNALKVSLSEFISQSNVTHDDCSSEALGGGGGGDSFALNFKHQPKTHSTTSVASPGNVIGTVLGGHSEAPYRALG